MNPDNTRRILTEINKSLRVLDSIHEVENRKWDIDYIHSAIQQSMVEELRIQPDRLEEMWEVKPLHDRIHSIVIFLRITRNYLEAMEGEAENALQKARELSRAIEEPEDHEL